MKSFASSTCMDSALSSHEYMTGPGPTAERAVHEVAECHCAWLELQVKGYCEVLSTSTEDADRYTFSSAWHIHLLMLTCLCTPKGDCAVHT